MSRDKTLNRLTNKSIAARSQRKDWAKKLEALTGQALEISKPQGAVYLVIDCSRSMGERNKLEQAKNGGKRFADEARKKGYAIGLIQFDSNARHLIEPQRELASFYPGVESLCIGGSTNMAAGIRMATENLAGRKKGKVMCIVTDGQPDDRTAALNAANEAKNMGIELLTIGTDDADKSFLEELATRTELSMKVSSKQLEQGITSMAKMLPDKTRLDA